MKQEIIETETHSTLAMKPNSNRIVSGRRPAAWRLIPVVLLCPLAATVGSLVPPPGGGQSYSPPTPLDSWSFNDTTN
jgi:hypothetical protein